MRKQMAVVGMGLVVLAGCWHSGKGGLDTGVGLAGLPAPKGIKDRYGNSYKAFACVHDAVILQRPEDNAPLVRTLRFGEPLLVFEVFKKGGESVRYEGGSDPRGVEDLFGSKGGQVWIGLGRDPHGLLEGYG